VQFDRNRPPALLRERKQWVVWRYEWDGKKWTKMPYRVGTKRRARCNKPQDWVTFEKAVATWHASDDIDGIMFVFTPDDPFCGIDLDNCIDADGRIMPEAQEIITTFESYAETSPSTKGVKLFIIGTKRDFAECRSTAIKGFNEIEIYDCGRFFVVTGAHLVSTPSTVEPRQEQLDALCAQLWPPKKDAEHAQARMHVAAELSDEEVIDKLSNWRNSSKFLRLHKADSGDYGGDASRGDLAYCGMLAFATGGDAAQIDRIFRNHDRMRPKWDERRGGTTYGERTIAKALRGKTEFYMPPKRPRTPRAAVRVLNTDELSERAKLHSDIGNAARLVKQHGDHIRFCHQTGVWYVWDKTHWQADDRGRIVKLCKDTALSQLDEAKRADDRDRDSLLKWARTSQKRDRLTAMAELAKPDVAVIADELDRDGFLFNCRNGTLDLRTGELRPHDPSDLITNVAPVRFDPDAKCPQFDRFMEETFCGNVELIEFVDRWLGHCLTGDVSEQYLVIGIGGGDNGKNVLCDTISSLLGRYACEAPPTLLTVRKHAEHPTEIADLMGKRLVIASETERDEELRLQLIKRLTGNARLKGRFVRKDYVEFDRTHKLMLLTNNMPHISEDSHAVWRRLLVVPFDNVVAEKDQDKRLLAKLAKECSGILARLVRGCLSWRKNGLSIPDTVKLATAKLQGESNSFLLFLRECCELNPRVLVRTADLRKAYEAYCEDRNARPVDVACMARALRAQGCATKKHKTAWHWFGVALAQSTGHGGHPGRGLNIDPQSLPHKEVNGTTTSTVSTMSTEPTSRGQES